MSSSREPESTSDSANNPITIRLDRIMDPNHPLCREDVIWLLNTIKNKLIENHAGSALPYETLLYSYRYYTEVSMLMLQRNSTSALESERLRLYMKEAARILSY